MKGLFSRRGKKRGSAGANEDYQYSEEDVEQDSPSLTMTEECHSPSSSNGYGNIPAHMPGYPPMFCCSVAPVFPAPTDSIMTASSNWGAINGDKYLHQEEFRTAMSISTDDKSLMPSIGRPSRPEMSPSRILREMAESLSEFLCAFDNGYYNLNQQKGCCIYCGQCDCCLCTGTSLSFDGLSSFRAIQNEIYKLRKTLEYEIRQMLGSASEQAGKCLEIIRDWLCTFSSISSKGQPEQMRVILLHNRRHVIHAYQKRVHKLRTEMHFNRNSHTDRHALLPATRSLDGSTTRPDPMNKACSLKYTTYSPGSSMPQLNSSPEELVCAAECVDISLSEGSICPENDQDFCYDSDPGDYRQRHIVHERASSLNDQNYCHATVTQRVVRALIQEETSMFCTSSSDEDDIPSDSQFSFDFSNDDMVSRFIRELINDNITLVYHPLQTESNIIASPVCVSAWFEMGSRLKDKVIQPKFMWRPAYRPDQMSKKAFLCCKPPDAVELLNIVRVLKPNYLNRDQHPFAKLQNSFSLQSNTNQIYLFEAYSEQDCDRFVHGLKLLVARLASKIIVGDEDVFEEFFTPWGKTLDHSPNGNYLLEEPTGSSISEDSSVDNGQYFVERQEIFKFNEVFVNR